MALMIEDIDLIVQGTQHLRRGVIYTPTLNVSARTSSTVTAASVEMIKQKDESDVTSDFFPVTTTSLSGTVITLPPLTVAADAELGKYILTVEYTAGGFAPDRPAVEINVTD